MLTLRRSSGMASQLLCRRRSSSALQQSWRHWLLLRRPFSTPAASDLPYLDVSYPAFTVWGSNTDVGKTLVSAGMAASLLSKGSSVLYVKPLQTGFPQDSDSGSVFHRVGRVLSASSSSRFKKVHLSNCIQHVSPAVAAAIDRQHSELPPHLDKLTGLHGPFRYAEMVLEASKRDDGMLHTVTRAPVVGECSEHSSAASVFVAATMWSWFRAVSPHLVAREENFTVSDSSILQTLATLLSEFPKTTDASSGTPQKWALVETAGGVASPAPSGTLQCDLYRPLRLPGLLIGDGKLGGISSTITAFEGLLLRGFDVSAIVLVDHGLGNEEQLAAYLQQRVPVIVLPSIPQDASDDLMKWFVDSGRIFSQLQEVLEAAHLKRMQRLLDMPKKAGQLLWWPFTQHSLIADKDVTVIDSRSGESFMIFKRTEDSQIISKQFDACASWWTQGPDINLQPELARQIGYAAGRFGHVILPENVCEPVLHCAELLIQLIGSGWADRVYYSDNGSTAIEIAIKMAFRKYLSDHNLLTSCSRETDITDGGKFNLKVLALKGSYHGDTLGAQEAQSPSAYTGFLQQPWYRGRGLFLDTPYIYMNNRQWVVEVPNCFWKTRSEIPATLDLVFSSRNELFLKSREESQVADAYKSYISRELSSCSNRHDHVAALIIEPVIHGAGGMCLIDPLFQRLLIDECNSKNIPVIFDEVFAGCWRLGVQSCTELLDRKPDIGCYSKLLTGGTVPLAVTLASSSVFEAFQGDSKLLALLHGHSYSGHPIGCQAAVTALQWFSNSVTNQNLLPTGRHLQELWEPEMVSEISAHPAVTRVIALGTVFAVELKASQSEIGYASLCSRSFVHGLRQKGIYLRPLGNVIYLMCSPLTPPATCSKILHELSVQLDVFEADRSNMVSHKAA